MTIGKLQYTVQKTLLRRVLGCVGSFLQPCFLDSRRYDQGFLEVCCLRVSSTTEALLYKKRFIRLLSTQGPESHCAHLNNPRLYEAVKSLSRERLWEGLFELFHWLGFLCTASQRSFKSSQSIKKRKTKKTHKTRLKFSLSVLKRAYLVKAQADFNVESHWLSRCLKCMKIQELCC